MAWMLTRLFWRRKARQTVDFKSGLSWKRALRAIAYVFNVHTLVLLGCSWFSVWFCNEMEWSFNMDFSIVSTGTIFPLTFTLAQAFTRRERCTALIASIKASVVALYWMHRDWDQSCGYPGSLGRDDLPGPVNAKKLLTNLLLSLRAYLTTRGPFESIGEARLTAMDKAGRAEWRQLFEHDMHLNERTRLFRSTVAQLVLSDPSQRHLKDCYKWLSKLSVLNERLTLAAGYTRGGEGGLSRTNQYLRYIAANLEELRSIKEYRTPTMMRHACGVLFHIYAIVLAPYFVHYCANLDIDVCAPGYASAFAYVVIVSLLFNVQQDMENCMDERGLDDAFFHVAEEFDEITGDSVLHSNDGSVSGLSHAVQGASPLERHASIEIPRTSVLGGQPSLKTIPSEKALQDMESDPLLAVPSSTGVHHHHSHKAEPSHTHAHTPTHLIPTWGWRAGGGGSGDAGSGAPGSTQEKGHQQGTERVGSEGIGGASSGTEGAGGGVGGQAHGGVDERGEDAKESGGLREPRVTPAMLRKDSTTALDKQS